jgi:tetratricopeptide (TPR) repeat protein
MLMLRSGLLLLLFCAALSAGAIPGSQEDQGGNVEAAESAYQAKDWAKATRLYEQLANSHPKSGIYWYRLGVSLEAIGEHQVALEALAKSQAAGTPSFMVGFSRATVYASMGELEKAFQALGEAVKQGFNDPDTMLTDPNLQPLRSDSRFPPLLEQVKHNQKPCFYSAENRQFDFWVGDWDVVATADSVPRGSSHIARELGDCVIWENWTSLTTGYAGKSYNVYNPDLKRWEQFWVDNNGGMIHFYGGLKDGNMDYWTDEIPQPDGTRLKRHLQFFNVGPDKVRQFSQGSTDGGKSWQVEYDFTYLRKKGS